MSHVGVCPAYFSISLSSWHLTQPSKCRYNRGPRDSLDVPLVLQLSFVVLEFHPGYHVPESPRSPLAGDSLLCLSSSPCFSKHMDCSFWVCWMVLPWLDRFAVESHWDNAPVSTPVCHSVSSCQGCSLNHRLTYYATQWLYFLHWERTFKSLLSPPS